MIGRVILAGGAVLVPLASFGIVARRAGRRLLAAPRATPDERGLAGALDALGGEVVRLRARDGIRLAARWLPAVPASGDGRHLDPHEAVLLLHGYSGSIAPDLVEFAPFLRRTAAVLGLDFRGHGGSDDGPTTFGLLEIEDVAGALSWLGERGVTRVALVGTSMGGMTAIAATAVLGDGTLASADAVPDAPSSPLPPPRPRIVGIVGDSVTPEVRIVVASRIGGRKGRFVADRALAGAARQLGEDVRIVEPARMLPLLEDLPVLLIHGEADDTLPIEAGLRLASLGGPGTEHWIVPGAGHSRAHATDPAAWEARVEGFLRRAFDSARE